MKKIFFVILYVFGIILNTFSQTSGVSIENIIKNRPSPPKLVNDYAGILTSDQSQALEAKLVKLDDSTSTQIAIIIVPSLGGMDPADVSLKIGRSWGVGNKKNNSGVVFLIATEDRKVNISPGYGLEGALPDITASHIIRDVVAPNFKSANYYRGINEGTDAIIKAVKGEYKTPRDKRSGSSPLKIGLIILIVIIILILFSGGGGGGTFMSRRGAGPFFFPMGGGFGSGGGGSSGGGGFGGFGGGSFGGGGASGSW
jgi:uncharacterized protein